MRSFGSLSARRRKGENRREDVGIKKYKLVVQNRQESVKNSIRKWSKEFICIIYGHVISRDYWREWR